MELRTRRLILRPITMEDAQAIFEYSRQESVGTNAGWKPHATLEENRAVLQDVFVGKENVFAIVLQENGKLIGSLGLVDDPKRENNRARMLGYALSEKYWGKGIMTEAVQTLLRYAFERQEIDLVSAYCYPHNRRSRNVLQKCGFEYEGRLRQCELRFDAKMMDLECFSLLRERWSHIPPAQDAMSGR